MAQKRISDFSVKPKQNKKRPSLQLADQSDKEADLVLEPMPSGQPTSSSCNSSSKATTTSAPDLGPGAALIQGNMNVAATAVPPAQNTRVIDLVEAITPHQPADFIFPGRQFGKETFSRSFNTNWFDKWRWLHYIEEGDRVVRFNCVKAVEKRLINEDSVRFDSSFVKRGFTNWRKATEKFNEHEKSKLHCDAIKKIAAAVQSTRLLLFYLMLPAKLKPQQGMFWS